MTAATDTLLCALEACDMLEIDGLHAFDFTLDEQRLLIECMDGRAAKRWSFTPVSYTHLTLPTKA